MMIESVIACDCLCSTNVTNVAWAAKAHILVCDAPVTFIQHLQQMASAYDFVLHRREKTDAEESRSSLSWSVSVIHKAVISLHC